MIPIELQIYFNTDETDNLEKMGIEADVRNCETRFMTFYTINAIGSATEIDGFEYGLIHTGDDTFATVLTYEELKQIINPQQATI